jgi:hypothetical protein
MSLPVAHGQGVFIGCKERQFFVMRLSSTMFIIVMDETAGRHKKRSHIRNLRSAARESKISHVLAHSISISARKK